MHQKKVLCLFLLMIYHSRQPIDLGVFYAAALIDIVKFYWPQIYGLSYFSGDIPPGSAGQHRGISGRRDKGVG
jgi:hypothetical protein